MTKKLVAVFLAGWLLALLFPPGRVLGMFTGKRPS
jgi:hypothetical protein